MMEKEGRMGPGEREIKQDSSGDSYALSKQDLWEGSRRPGIAPSTTSGSQLLLRMANSSSN